MTTPYTYRIGWQNKNLHYYGVRHAKNCCPTDLWKKYFTSSNIVKNTVKKLGNPDIIEVRKKFNNVNDALEWERKVLKKLNVLENKNWLNSNIAGSFIFHSLPKSAEHKKKISNAHKKIKHLWLYGNNNASGNNGKKKTQEHKDKISIAHKGMKKPWAIGNNYATALKGRKKTAEHQAKIIARLNDPEVKVKIKATRDLRPIVKCPHCDVEGKQGHNMKRYHFDNCRRK